MFAAALLASLLAQAEQAPVAPAPEPSPGTAIPAAPGPAEPLTPPSSSPPPPSPSPPSLPAPVPPPPPGVVAEPAPIPPPNAASVYVRYAYRVGNGDGVVPASGLSLGGEYERRLRAFETGIELGAAIDFFYDRFTRDVIATSVGPMGDPEPAIGTRTLSHTTFALMETTGWRYADMRLYVGVGAGVTVGYFVSPDISSRGNTDLQPLVRGVFGFDFAIAARTSAVLRIDYTHTLSRDAYFLGQDGTLRPVFGDLFDAGVGFLLRF